jgi:hypothetical protein
MHTISLKIPDDLYLRLRSVVESSHLSQSLLLRQGLEQRLEQLQTAPLPPTLLEQAQALGLVGSVSFGPADLSTNPDYLEGYGMDRHP